MARMLSALLTFKAAPPQAVLEALNSLFTPATGGGINILHYAWLTVLPDAFGGGASAMLTTVYDEDFYDYVHDLVVNNPAPFNAIIPLLKGAEACIDPATGKPDVMKYLPTFIKFVQDNDLAHPGRAKGSGYLVKGSFEGYDLTVKAILALQSAEQATA